MLETKAHMWTYLCGREGNRCPFHIVRCTTCRLSTYRQGCMDTDTQSRGYCSGLHPKPTKRTNAVLQRRVYTPRRNFRLKPTKVKLLLMYATMSQHCVMQACTNTDRNTPASAVLGGREHHSRRRMKPHTSHWLSVPLALADHVYRN